MSRRARFLAIQFAGLGVALALLIGTARPPPKDDSSLLVRVLGPAARFAASIEWVRFDLALRSGDLELAYARADTALWIDPGATEGWNAYAAHLAFDRASAEREPDPVRRRAWFDAALATLARGEAVAREPGDLALFAGLLRMDKAKDDPALAGSDGVRSLYLAAADDFDRAARLGKTFAVEGAAKARELAANAK
ncbi:MAG: hypothetical protein K8S98_17840 [Planctomycetes bacterium]|nr:hypothetical protein [Planctomycetota bacterium]